MRPYFGLAGNPASAHALGREARRALEDARERIAAWLGAEPESVIFTSGATEANNLALFGLAGDPPGRILSSAIEHPCVVEPIRQLGERGFTVEELPVGRDGIVVLPERIPDGVRLIAFMRVNHETGAIQPTVPTGPYVWHCDAAQAVGKQPINFRELGATSLAFSGHKFGAPPGIGALLLQRGVKLRPAMFGGHQQQGRRPGTEPVALAVGLAAALDLACSEMDERRAHVESLRQSLMEMLAPAAPLVVNGPAESGKVSPYVLNVSFPGLRADALTVALDLEGIACATGSACSSGSLLPSPVLRAMQVSEEVLRSAIRLSFSHISTKEEVQIAAKRIAECVTRLRNCKS